MEERKTLVEQLRDMVEKSREGNQYPPVYADAIIGHLCVSKSDERELFTAIADRIESEYMPLPLDADGMLIRPGDNVFFVEGDESHEVFGFDYDSGKLEVHIGRHDGTSTDALVSPCDLTHKQTDTMERIEADAKKMFNDYWGCGDAECHCCTAVVDGKKPYERYGTDSCANAQRLDLLRRQREVMERGQE